MVAGLDGLSKYRSDYHIPRRHSEGPPVIVVAESLFRLNGLVLITNHCQAFECIASRWGHRQRDSFALHGLGLVHRHDSVFYTIGNGDPVASGEDQPGVCHLGKICLTENAVFIHAAKLIAGYGTFKNRTLRDYDGKVTIAVGMNIIRGSLQV